MIVVIYGLFISIPICMIIGGCTYFVMRRKNNVSHMKILRNCVFSCYLCVLFSVTFLGRPRISGISVIPFISYIEACQSSSLIEWRNILINIVMFIPAGILLPCVIKHQWSLTKLILSIALFSFIIEIAQMLTNRGIFELDDIINNTLGFIIGYALIRNIKKNILKG